MQIFRLKTVSLAHLQRKKQKRWAFFAGWNGEQLIELGATQVAPRKQTARINYFLAHPFLFFLLFFLLFFSIISHAQSSNKFLLSVDFFLFFLFFSKKNFQRNFHATNMTDSTSSVPDAGSSSSAASSSANPGDRSYLTSSFLNAGTEYIANTLEGYGRNVARFRISGLAQHCQIAVYIWRPDEHEHSDSKEAFSVACFSGSVLPASEELRDFASFISISEAELHRGVWLMWAVDRTEDVCLLFDAAGADGSNDADSRYYLNGLIIDPLSSQPSSTSEGDSKAATFLGKAEDAPPGAGSCGGVYIGKWDTDYHVPPFPSSPEGSPRLVGYHLNAGKSIRVRRRHYPKNERNPRGLPKMPAWHDSDPTDVGLDAKELGRAREVFAHFDHDDNEYIDRSEMHRVAEHVYEILKEEKVTAAHIDRLFDKFDTNKDEKLNLEEFQRIFLQLKEDLIEDGLLQPYPKHFQWRLTEQLGWVPPIKIAGVVDSGNDDEPTLVPYPVQPNSWAFFDPQYYGYQTQAAPAADLTLPYYPELPAQRRTKVKHVYHQVPVIVPTPPPAPPEDPRLAAFQVPPLGGAPYELLFPEMHALRDLVKLKKDLPKSDYQDVQAGLLRFLKLRLGMTNAQASANAHARAYQEAQQQAALQNAILHNAVLQEAVQVNQSARKKDKQRAAAFRGAMQPQFFPGYGQVPYPAAPYQYDPSAAYAAAATSMQQDPSSYAATAMSMDPSGYYQAQQAYGHYNPYYAGYYGDVTGQFPFPQAQQAPVDQSGEQATDPSVIIDDLDGESTSAAAIAASSSADA